MTNATIIVKVGNTGKIIEAKNLDFDAPEKALALDLGRKVLGSIFEQASQ